MDDPTNPTPKKGRRVPRTWQERFLASLAAYGNVSAAAKAARVARDTAYEHRKTDAAFATAWDTALIVAVEGLEYEAWRRGQRGVLEPVYQGGKEVGHIRKYSDTLLIFLLKAHDPKYRETSRHELTGKDGAPLIPDPPAPLSLDELRAMVGVLAAAGALDAPPDADA